MSPDTTGTDLRPHQAAPRGSAGSGPVRWSLIGETSSPETRRPTGRRYKGACRRPIDNEGVQIRIEASDLPGRSCGPSPDRPGGHSNIHVGVQRRNQPDELLGLVPGDAPSATWTLDCQANSSSTGVDLTGPYIQGRPGGRFIYLSWGTVDEAHDFMMFRRAKLQLAAIPPAVLENAVERGLLVGRLGLADTKGSPLCAAVRPPVIDWSAAPSMS